MVKRLTAYPVKNILIYKNLKACLVSYSKTQVVYRIPVGLKKY